MHTARHVILTYVKEVHTGLYIINYLEWFYEWIIWDVTGVFKWDRDLLVFVV